MSIIVDIEDAAMKLWLSHIKPSKVFLGKKQYREFESLMKVYLRNQDEASKAFAEGQITTMATYAGLIDVVQTDQESELRVV